MATKTRTRKPKAELTAAQKAWATRRANGDPSESARKAWATRKGTKVQPRAKARKRTTRRGSK